MTGPVPPAPPGRPEGPPGGDRIAVGKALVLLVVAVVVGILCLQVGARPTVVPAGGSGATATTTTTSPAGARSTTTTTAPHPNPAVKVVVANGGTVTGAAAFFTSKLQSDGWSTDTPTNATPVSASAVYYATGQQQPANEVASDLGLPASVVHPVATATPVQGTTGADVVVVVGPDLSSQVSSTTTTTAATTGTATTSTASAATSSSPTPAAGSTASSTTPATGSTATAG